MPELKETPSFSISRSILSGSSNARNGKAPIKIKTSPISGTPKGLSRQDYRRAILKRKGPAGPKGKLPEEVEVITSTTVMGGQEFEVKEVSPPGWGHTKAEKEKTKPNKPKSKIGGSAHEFDKDLKSGKFKGLPGDKTMKDKKASMFKLMWSMKNKGDKPHYKPGVKDKLKAKYKDESVLDSAKRYLDNG